MPTDAFDPRPGMDWCSAWRMAPFGKRSVRRPRAPVIPGPWRRLRLEQTGLPLSVEVPPGTRESFYGDALDFSLELKAEFEIYGVEIDSPQVVEPHYFKPPHPWSPELVRARPPPNYDWVAQRRRTLLAGLPAQQECHVVLETGERTVTYFIEVSGRPVRIRAHIPFPDRQEDWPTLLSIMESLRIEARDAGP